jgi:phage shock protein C
MKKLYRSDTNKVWKGIIGGFGEYFNIDPVLLRVIFIFFVLATGIVPGLITYIIALWIVPKKPIQQAEIVD